MPFTDDDRYMLVEVHTDMKNLKKNDEDKEKRLRVLERGRFKEIGATGAISGIVGYFAHMLFK